MMSLFNCLLLVAVSVISLVNAQGCVYKVDDNFELDLTPMAGHHLTGVYLGEAFYVTPCRNDLECIGAPNGDAFTAVRQEPGNHCTGALGVFTDAQQPVIDVDSQGGTFTFHYSGAATDGTCVNGIQTSVSYICGDGEMNDLQIHSSTDGCGVTIEEYTELACVQGPPDFPCVWTDPPLDLTGLYNQVMSIECQYNVGSNQYLMQYQPCQNKILCGTFAPSMAQIETVLGACITSVMDYDDSVVPRQITYNGANAYELAYTNGTDTGECQLTPRTLTVTFRCDPNANAYNPSGVTCGQTDSCFYHMVIPTMYACE